MKKRTVVVGAGALTLLVVAVGLSLRPGSDPVAAQQPAPVVTSSPNERGAPAVARLGNQQIDVPELKSVLASLPAESREQLRGNRGALESWLRSRLAQRPCSNRPTPRAGASARRWSNRPAPPPNKSCFATTCSRSARCRPTTPAPLVQQAYDAGKAQWITPPMYRVSQIFLALNDPQSVDAVRRRPGTEPQGPGRAGDFAALATQYSQDPDTAQRGGDSGLQPLQQLVPAVREAVSRLKVGAVSEVVQSPAGFHVLKLTAQQPARTATLDELRERLTQALRAQRQEQIAKAYLEGMLNTATLSIDGAQLNQVLE